MVTESRINIPSESHGGFSFFKLPTWGTTHCATPSETLSHYSPTINDKLVCRNWYLEHYQAFADKYAISQRAKKGKVPCSIWQFV
jgi:hypothetical protein